MTSLNENRRDINLDDLENKCEIDGAGLTEKHGWRGDCCKILKIFMGIEAIPQDHVVLNGTAKYQSNV
ncbi:hypothetical protein NC652_016815 [Populus alba x Populus x berolinensis]|nr:hypothetical protein NC652_016814 [Populus alba x Populus x berolinensis]KAJ6923283.1 hypothetical protein NC652_016815 [Populus alba x Populus x berolinensis]